MLLRHLLLRRGAAPLPKPGLHPILAPHLLLHLLLRRDAAPLQKPRLHPMLLRHLLLRRGAAPLPKPGLHPILAPHLLLHLLLRRDAAPLQKPRLHPMLLLHLLLRRDAAPLQKPRLHPMLLLHLLLRRDAAPLPKPGLHPILAPHLLLHLLLRRDAAPLRKPRLHPMLLLHLLLRRGAAPLQKPRLHPMLPLEPVAILVGPGTSGKLDATSNWARFLCPPSSRARLPQRRKKRLGRLRAFYDRRPLEVFETCVWRRQPAWVLSLPGDTKKEPPSLGFLESGPDRGQLKHLDKATDRGRTWNSGARSVSCAAPHVPRHARDPPPAWHLFQFRLLLQYAGRTGSPRPFFWLFVDPLVLNREDQDVVCCVLNMQPATIPDNAVRVRSNTPARRSRRSAVPAAEALSALAQHRRRSKLPAQRPAKLLKNRFLPPGE
ncbi:LOW QUALITY PROTEIN: DNA -methyltransferase 3-like [Plecturocebus cupreus]